MTRSFPERAMYKAERSPVNSEVMTDHEENRPGIAFRERRDSLSRTNRHPESLSRIGAKRLIICSLFEMDL